MQIIQKCKQCNNPFEINSSELTRKTKSENQGCFCSYKCAMIYINKQRPFLNKICKICFKPFKSKNKNAKYCSYICKTTNKVTKEKRNYCLNAKINKIIKTDECFHCHWNLAICDIHHVVERQYGGLDDLNNLIVVCPNCHRLIHKNKLDAKSIPTVNDILKNNGAVGIETEC